MFRKPKVQQVHDESPYATLSSTVNAAAKSKVPANSKKKGPPPLPPPRSATLPRHFHLQQFGGNDGNVSASPKRHSQISVDGRLLKAALRKSLSIDRESLPSSEPCQLSHFITKNSNFLPLRVGVCNGFCSSATDLSISQNEKFNLHFVKHTRVIVMRDSEIREEYSVPLNSSVRFGIVYDPIQDEKRALQGFYFETVGELIAMKQLPTVVCATKAYSGSSFESSVEANEILLIKGVTARSTLRGKGKVLKLYSLKHGLKQLAEKCAGGFSTEPKRVGMHLSKMMEHSIIFPQKAMLIADYQIDTLLSSSMATLPVTLEKAKGETSVIATNSEEEAIENVVKLDISSELDVEVEAVCITEAEESLLHKNTHSLYDAFNISTLQFVVDKSSSRAYDLQCLLYKRVLPGMERDGVQLTLPSLLQPQVDENYDDTASFTLPTLPHKASARSLSTEPDTASPEPENVYQIIQGEKCDLPDNEYIDMKPDDDEQQQCTTRVLERLNELEYKYNTVELQIAQISERMEVFASRVEEMAQTVELLNSKQQQIGSQSDAIDSLRSCFTSLQEEIRQLQVKPPPPRPSPRPAREASSHRNTPTTPEQNREFVSSLDYVQVGLICFLYMYVVLAFSDIVAYVPPFIGLSSKLDWSILQGIDLSS